MSDIVAFSQYMFVSNKDNRPIYLDLQGIENNKDLFLFLIDLFCKGLVVCYGNGGNQIDFDDLSMERFSYIKAKMANAGIVINLNIENMSDILPTYINSEEIETEDENKPLEYYIFKIQKQNLLYKINFTLDRPPIR